MADDRSQLEPQIRVRLIVWCLTTVLVALLVIVAPAIVDTAKPHHLRSLFASSEVALTGLVVMIGGNSDLVLARTNTRKGIESKALIQSGALLTSIFGALIYTRLYDLKHSPSDMDARLTGVLLFMCLVDGVAAVGTAAAVRSGVL